LWGEVAERSEAGEGTVTLDGPRAPPPAPLLRRPLPHRGGGGGGGGRTPLPPRGPRPSPPTPPPLPPVPPPPPPPTPPPAAPSPTRSASGVSQPPARAEASAFSAKPLRYGGSRNTSENGSSGCASPSFVASRRKMRVVAASASSATFSRISARASAPSST